MLPNDMWVMIIQMCNVGSLINLGRSSKSLHKNSSTLIKSRMDILHLIIHDPRVSLDESVNIQRLIRRTVANDSSTGMLQTLPGPDTCLECLLCVRFTGHLCRH